MAAGLAGQGVGRFAAFTGAKTRTATTGRAPIQVRRARARVRGTDAGRAANTRYLKTTTAIFAATLAGRMWCANSTKAATANGG